MLRVTLTHYSCCILTMQESRSMTSPGAPFAHVANMKLSRFLDDLYPRPQPDVQKLLQDILCWQHLWGFVLLHHASLRSSSAKAVCLCTPRTSSAKAVSAPAQVACVE